MKNKNDRNTEKKEDLKLLTGTEEPEKNEQRQYVTFIIGEESFAIDMEMVYEIVRVPETVHVPLAPQSLKGLANLRGKILPIISIRNIFGMEDIPVDDAVRALIVNTGQLSGFVVDKVSSVISVSSSQIEPIKDINSSVKVDLLKGVIKNSGNHEMVLIIDIEKIIEQHFSTIKELDATNTGFEYAETREVEENNDREEELQLVSFDVAAQKYAIAIENIQEIVLPPERMTSIPRSEEHIEGVITLRNRLLPVLSLRALFNMSSHQVDDKSRIVVVSKMNTSIGLLVDGVSEVLRISKSDVEPVPAIMNQAGNLSDISGICHPHSDRETICILSVDSLFNNSTVKEAIDSMETVEKDNISSEIEKEDEQKDEDEQLIVVFRLNDEEFGVPITSVQEIVRIPDELTHVPRTPSFVEGVINLRGSVLPVIDMRRKIGLSNIKKTDRQRIMVFLIGQIRVGFIVDSVTEVLKVSKSCLEQAPKISTEQSRLIRHVVNMGDKNRIIQIMEPAYIVKDIELKELTSMA